MFDLRFTIYDFIRRAGVWLGIAALGASCAGCTDKFLDPTQVGRFRPTPAVNVILDSLGVAEEAPAAWEEAEEPRPSDIVPVETDYKLRPSDVVRVSIFELFQEAGFVINDYTVSETGNISIPEVGVIQAVGRTETELEDEIKQILSPNILREPSVTVMLVSSQQRAFSILGNGVPRAGRYFIPRYDYRLLDALATAGAQMQFNVSYVYVSRREGAVAAAPGAGTEGGVPELETIEPGLPENVPPSAPPVTPQLQGRANPNRRMEVPEPSEPAGRFELEREMLELIAPQAKRASPENNRVAETPARGAGDSDMSATMMPAGFRLLGSSRASRMPRPAPEQIVQSPAEFGTVTPDQPVRAEPQPEPRTEWIFQNGKWIQVPVPGVAGREPPVAEGEPGQEYEWVFRDGRWIPVPKGAAPPAGPPVTRVAPPGPTLPLEGEQPPPEFGWEQVVQGRSIRIPADRLLAGDPRYNIIIQPGDTIHVPVDLIGEFAIMGNVNRAGFINITGRPMTLKMAIAAAGGLGPLAWPKHCEVVRRVGTRKEEIVLVDLDKIASGEQPDFFIKPFDLINVGTHPTSRWRAVLRNAFRAAYGFGFVYDRNFADADFGKGFRLPSWL